MTVLKILTLKHRKMSVKDGSLSLNYPRMSKCRIKKKTLDLQVAYKWSVQRHNAGPVPGAMEREANMSPSEVYCWISFSQKKLRWIFVLGTNFCRVRDSVLHAEIKCVSYPIVKFLTERDGIVVSERDP